MNRENARNREMLNRILLGTALAAVAAGVIYYINHQEEVNDRLSNLKDKAADALDKAKTKVSQRVDDVRSRAQR